MTGSACHDELHDYMILAESSAGRLLLQPETVVLCEDLRLLQSSST
jgi:hypothetical protein